MFGNNVKLGPSEYDSARDAFMGLSPNNTHRVGPGNFPNKNESPRVFPYSLYYSSPSTFLAIAKKRSVKSLYMEVAEAEKYIEAEAKLDLLFERAERLKEINKNAVKELEAQREKGVKLKQLYHELNKETDALQEIATQRRYTGSTGRFLLSKEITWEHQKEILNEKHQKEREKIKKEMAAAVNFLNENEDFQVLSTGESNWLTHLYSAFGNFVDWILPLKSDVEYVKARYDYTISGFFIFYRFLVGFSILTALIFTFLLVYHVLNYNNSFTELTDGIYPTFTLFSGFSTDFATKYAGTVQAFILISIICTLSRWIRFFEDKTKRKLYDTKDIKYSKLLFNYWDWTVNEQTESANLNATNLNEFKLLLYEETIKGIIEKRGFKEKATLFTQRTALLILNGIIVVCGWGGIAVLYFYEKEIISYTSGIFGLNYIAAFIPGMALSVINYMIPTVSIYITGCEKWDYVSTRVKNEIWKQFLTIILNIVIVCAISLEFSFRTAYFSDTPIMSQLAEYPCREDQIATMFLKLVFVTTLGMEILHWCWDLLGLNKMMFLVSGEAVAILYFQGIVLCTLLYCPYFAWIAPVLFYLRFKYAMHALSAHKQVPNESSASPDTENFLMIYYVITLLVVISYYNIFMQQDAINGDCGPFLGMGIPANLVFAYLEQFPVLGYIVNGILYAPILWLGIFMALWDVIYTTSKNTSLKEYGKMLQKEHRKQVELLNRKIKMLQKQLEINKMSELEP